MKKLFGLFLLALAFLAPSVANAVNCFWVGGIGTWDNTSITHWAPTTGAAATGCQTTNAAPAAGDTITFDANSGGGTVTPDGTIAGIAFGSLSAGGFTSGTLAFNTNNPSVSFTTVSFTGTVTRTINMGSGTWTLTGTTSTALFDISNATNATLTFSNAPIVISGNSVYRTMQWGGNQTFNSLTIGANSTKGLISCSAGNTTTWASITVASGNTIAFPQSLTTTITGALTMTGTSSAPVGAIAVGAGAATISVGSASTIDWGGVMRITKSGAGSITATNSLDMGGNTSVSISAPPSDGGGSRCIGC